MSDAHPHFDALLTRAKPLDPVPTTVIAPESDHTLAGALLAADHSLITPILFGDVAKMSEAAGNIGRSLDGIEMHDIADHDAAALAAVAHVHCGHAGIVMKGQIHTNQLLKAVMNREKGLRAGRRLSHVFTMDIPGHPRLLSVTDGAINIDPDLETKADIAQNAIDLLHALGVETPKVAVMSAVEKVNPALPNTLDAAELAKRDFNGGIVDGPFAMDNAVNIDAARIKGIDSPVAGAADILLAPHIEAGNMVVKTLTFLAGAQTGGLVMGAAKPVILTSRADDDRARLASAVMAVLSYYATLE